MGRPLVSVVIPAYNHEKFIGSAIDSVLGQSCDDLELIVVDDGSTDQTGDVAQGYQDSRLAYYYQDNQDAYNTINRGIGLARGRYLAILNSDDVYMPRRLEQLLQLCDQNDGVCAFSDVTPISDEGEVFRDPDFGWNIWHRNNRSFYFECGDLYTAFLHGNFMVTTSNLLMTAEASAAVGPFAPLRYLHDYDFIFRMMRAFPGRVHYADDRQLLQYRIHSGNTLGEAAIVGRQQDCELIKKYMLAAVPEAYRKYVETGSDRLVELERELQAVRAQLGGGQPSGVREALRELKGAGGRWLQKKLG